MNRLIPYSGEVYAYLLTGYREAHQLLEMAALAGLLALLFAGLRSAPGAGRALGLVLAGLWGWLAVGFYWGAYQPLNWAGGAFGWAALGQAGLLAVWGGLAGRLQPALPCRPLTLWAAVSIFLASALAGPVTLVIADDAVIAAQAFGVTPIATIAVTLALLLLNRSRAPVWLLPIPAALLGWACIRAYVLSVPQDMVLLGAAGLGLAMLVARFLRALSERNAQS